MNTFQKFFRGLQGMTFLLCAGLLFGGPNQLRAAEPAPESPASADEALRSYLQLQEQLHATQLALERNRQESEKLAARNAEAVNAKFKAIEAALTTQKLTEIGAMQRTVQEMQATVQSNNRLMLILGGSIAGVGFFVLLATGVLQWRSVNRLAEFSVLVQNARAALPSASSRSAAQLLGEGETRQASGQIFGALTQLEKRILELEHTAHPTDPGQSVPPVTGANGNAAVDHADHDSLLLAKGQSLLDLDKPAEAVACFEELLQAEPNHGEALVKKGIALEALSQPDEALRCYDQAIAANADLTIAYLQKGGLFNRLERYEEALQCYEQALHAQEKAHAA